MKKIYRYSREKVKNKLPWAYKKKLYIKYILAGGTAAATDLILLYILTDIFNIYYLISASLAFMVAFFISFYLQKFWTFRDDSKNKMYQQMTMYFFVGITNLGINTIGMYLLVSKVNIPYLLSQVIMGAMIAIFSFLIYNYFIFSALCGKNKIVNKKIKVLIATGVYPPDIGGPATYVKLLEDRLAKDKYNIKVVSFSKVRSLPKVISHLVYFYELIKSAKSANVIFAQDTISVGLPAMIAARLLGRKYLIRIAGDHAWEQARQRYGVEDNIEKFQEKQYSFKVEMFKKIRNIVSDSADMIITPSHYFKKVVSKWVNNPDKIQVIYNGIEIDSVQEKIIGDEAKENIIISAGRLVPWKGFSVLIEIMKDLDDWKLVIVGDGPDKKKLEAKIKELSLEDRVKLAGAIKRSELINYLFKANIFILNTSFESFSFQVVEAMAAGIPVITTRICNLEEIITDNKEGILVRPDNKKEIQQAINKLVLDNVFREMIINNARDKAKMFSIDITVDNLDKLIVNLCSHK